MGEEVNSYSMEDRRERVLQALHILAGDRAVLITEEKRAILKEYDELCTFGYGRMEVVVVAHHLEGINPTKHKKRKDLLSSPQTT
ncbi:hypothetical protein ES707_05093 [subsurface metagenome]